MSAATERNSRETEALDLALRNDAEDYAEIMQLCAECDRPSELADAMRDWVENAVPIYEGVNAATDALLGEALNAVEWHTLALWWRERYEANGGAA